MTAGNGAILLDTNILVYAYDRSDHVKQHRAEEILDFLTLRGAGVISTQVLGEFFCTVIRKLASPLSPEDAWGRVDYYVRAWTVLDVTGSVVLEAIRGVREHRLNYWDAQIWAAARWHQIPVILSEGFNDGAVLEKVRFLNPFRPSFRLADWIG
ncbi:MAG: PIN domain-containing protein [Acidobacteria bacterium]|nr:PIN domain-containing protein [Acidobacteriota bacterium]